MKVKMKKKNEACQCSVSAFNEFKICIENIWFKSELLIYSIRVDSLTISKWVAWYIYPTYVQFHFQQTSKHYHHFRLFFLSFPYSPFLLRILCRCRHSCRKILLQIPFRSNIKKKNKLKGIWDISTKIFRRSLSDVMSDVNSSSISNSSNNNKRKFNRQQCFKWIFLLLA